MSIVTNDVTNNKDFTQYLNLISQEIGMGARDTRIADILSGFNYRNVGMEIPFNRDMSGITFMTRPNMNLSYDNISGGTRLLAPLLTSDEYTWARVIRCYLDPVNNLFTQGTKVTTPLVDAQQAFIPLLTNALITSSSWPNPHLPTYTSKEGRSGENLSWADGTVRINGTWDLSMTYRNIIGDPISLMLYTQLLYMDLVHDGIVVPRMRSIATRRIDYQQRIFRFLTDPSGRYVTKWASTTGCIPLDLNMGDRFAYNQDEAYVHEGMDQITVSYRCHGAEYNDPILFDEFNDTVVIFNPNMADDLRAANYSKVDPAYYLLFNKAGYPRIDPWSQELEWWVDTATYTSRISAYKSLLTKIK